MRGYLIFSLSVLGMVGFSVLLFSASKLFLFWLFLELSSLCLMPLYFLGVDSLGLSSLFSYMIVSSLSSSLMMGGIMFESFVFFVLLGLLLKFGMFPFLGWVYNIMLGSNWWVIWGFSTLLKTSFFIMPFFILGAWFEFVSVFVGLTFLLLSVLFWFYSYGWRGCWCHMMLSSSGSLMAMSFGQSLDVLMPFFVLYLFWVSGVMVFLSRQNDFYLSGASSMFLFCFLLVSLPFSIPMFYKFLLTGYMFSCGIFLFGSWVLYSVSEQFYLLKFLMDTKIPRFGLGCLSFV